MSKGFWSREIWPRRDQIFFHRNVLFSLLLSGCLTFALSRWGAMVAVEVPSFSTVATATIAYGAVTFGACLAGATLAVALPAGRMLATMTLNSAQPGTRPVRLRYEDGNLRAEFDDDAGPVAAVDFSKDFRSRYLDLVFLFVYSAIVQLILIVLGSTVIVLLGATPIFACACDLRSSIALAVLTFVTLYSLAQLLACLRAIYQIAAIRDAYVRTSALRGQSPTSD
jgi:hypothetical protein